MNSASAKSTSNTKFNKNKASASEDKPKKVNFNSVINYTDFDISRLVVGDVDWKNERSVAQGIAYINYIINDNKSQFIMKTPDIIMFDRGIPRIDPKFYPDDSKRAFISIPFDLSVPTSLQLYKILESIDNYAIQNQERLMGALSSKYKYSPLIKDPNDEDNNDENKKKRPKYFKGKLDTSYPDGEVLTTFFVMENGKPVLQDVKTVTDAEKLVTFMCKAKYVITLNKLWAEKKEKMKGQPRSFGFSIKISQVVIVDKPNKGGSGTKDLLRNHCAFDDEETSQVEKSEPVSTNDKDIINSQNINVNIDKNNDIKDNTTTIDDLINDADNDEGEDDEGDEPEPVKAEPVKVEPVKVEPVKVEPVKVEPVKVEPVKAEPVKKTVKKGKN
jgi:hypothetical protein